MFFSLTNQYVGWNSSGLGSSLWFCCILDIYCHLVGIQISVCVLLHPFIFHYINTTNLVQLGNVQLQQKPPNWSFQRQTVRKQMLCFVMITGQSFILFSGCFVWSIRLEKLHRLDEWQSDSPLDTTSLIKGSINIKL